MANGPPVPVPLAAGAASRPIMHQVPRSRRAIPAPFPLLALPAPGGATLAGMSLPRLRQVASRRRSRRRAETVNAPGRRRPWSNPRLLKVGGLGIILAGAIVVVGFHRHSHLHGDLRVVDGEGNVMLVPEWRLTSDAAPVQLDPIGSGEFSFQLSNADGIPHDFLVVRTDAAASALPTTDGRVDLNRAGDVVGQITAVDPGKTGESGQIFLDEGKYVLFCNVPGHYSGGMYYQLTVQ